MADDFDFGFTAVDDIPAGERIEQPVQAEIPSDQIEKIMDKLEQLESRILASDNSGMINEHRALLESCLLYTSPSPRDQRGSRMPSSA